MAAIQIKTAARVVPQCYAYTTPGVPVHDGWTKIGFTERDVETRINEQTHTVGVAHKTWWAMRAAYMTDTAFNHIRRRWTLHLSGTPFKALANDKFPESAIYNWTYADEQKKKRDWDESVVPR